MTRRKPTIYAAIISILFLFSCGNIATGDVEPNDTRDTAENINVGQVILGSLDAASDVHDFHNISLEGGIEVVAILDGPADADYDLGIYDSEGLQVAGVDTDMDADEVVFYKPMHNGSYFVDVFAYRGSGSYTLEVKVPDMAPNTTCELGEAVSQGYIKAAFSGAYSGPAESFNLETGENVFFGRCVEIEIINVGTNDLDIVIPHGLLLISDNKAVEDKVLTSRHLIHAEALSKTTARLYAMSINMDKLVPDAGSSFQPGELAKGDLKKVVDEINTTDTQTASGQIAVWMVTDSAKRDELEQFGASDSEIEEALDILNKVGVEPPFTGDDGDSGLLICIGLIILMIVLIVVIGFISSRSKDRSMDSGLEHEEPRGGETPVEEIREKEPQTPPNDESGKEKV